MSDAAAGDAQGQDQRQTMEERVRQACDALDNRGEDPTNESVRTFLGGGSYSTIAPVVREWKRERKARSSRAEQPKAEQPNADEPSSGREISSLDALPDVARALEYLTGAVLGACNTILVREADASARQIRALQESQARELARRDEQVRQIQEGAAVSIAEAEAAAEAEVAEMAAAADAERSRAESLQAQVQDLSGQINGLTATVAERDQAILDRDGEIARLTGELEDLRKERNALETERNQVVAECNALRADKTAAEALRKKAEDDLAEASRLHEAEIVRLREARDAALRDLQACRERSSGLESALQGANSMADELRRERDTERARADRLEEALRTRPSDATPDEPAAAPSAQTSPGARGRKGKT